MAYYYVKSGGTAAAATDNGRYASQQTGSFATLGAANYYNRVTDALAATTPIGAGDYICCASDHSYTGYSANAVFVGPGQWTNDPATLVSVDVSNMENELAGAYESAPSHRLYLENMWNVKSMSLACGNSLFIDANTFVIANDTTFTIDGNNKAFILDSECYVELYNCTIPFTEVGGGTTQTINLFQRTKLYMKGCTTTHGTTPANIFADAEGSSLYVEDCDLSSAGSATMVAASSVNTNFTPFRPHKFHRCKLNASWAGPFDTAPDSTTGPDHSMLITQSGSTTGESESQFLYIDPQGQAEEETGIYRTGSAAYPSTAQTSLKVSTNTYTTRHRPFSFDFPTRYAELSAATDTIRIYIVSSTVLTSADVWVNAGYADGTTPVLPAYLSTLPDEFTTPALTTNTEAWTSPPATPNYYQLDIATAAGGSDCVPSIRVSVGKASSTIYFCPTVELI